jgi:hypothetical protein
VPRNLTVNDFRPGMMVGLTFDRFREFNGEQGITDPNIRLKVLRIEGNLVVTEMPIGGFQHHWPYQLTAQKPMLLLHSKEKHG